MVDQVEKQELDDTRKASLQEIGEVVSETPFRKTVDAIEGIQFYIDQIRPDTSEKIKKSIVRVADIEGMSPDQFKLHATVLADEWFIKEQEARNAFRKIAELSNDEEQKRFIGQYAQMAVYEDISILMLPYLNSGRHDFIRAVGRRLVERYNGLPENERKMFKTDFENPKDAYQIWA